MGKKSLQDRVAVVTGGASGIGYAIARTFIDEGARVAIVDISGERAHSASERLGASGAQLIVIAADIADESQVEAMFDEVVERFGRVDVLVHSAGIGVERTIFDTSLEEWNRVIRVNLTGSFLCARGAARRMAPKGFGRIVFLSSAAGLRGGTGRTAYGASKGGIIAMTRTLAVELAKFGITVNALAPGAIETELVARMHDQATRDSYLSGIPADRYGTPEEVAASALFLATDQASYVTGHILSVDGGFAAAGVIKRNMHRLPE